MLFSFVAKWTVLCSLATMVVAVLWLTLIYALAAQDETVLACAGASTKMRTVLLSVPIAERNVLWKCADFALSMLWDAPLFLAGSGGNRAVHYRNLEMASGGLAVSFFKGFALFDWAQVSEWISSDSQRRGRYLGAQPVAGPCFGDDALIFMSSGEEHTRMRNFIVHAVAAFDVSTASREERERLDCVDDGDGDEELTVNERAKRCLMATLFRRLFGVAASAADVDLMRRYTVYGAACVLGDKLDSLLLGAPSRMVGQLRAQMLDVARRSPLAARVLEASAREGYDGEAMLTQVVDGFLFAGLFGTTHLATSALDRLHSDPQAMVPLYERNATAFLIETARLDPPVTSVTGVTDAPRTVRVAAAGIVGGLDVHFDEGTTVQLIISRANRDPAAFGADAHQFNPQRATLDRTLSWNGVHVDVVGARAPRGCPGYTLAIDVVRLVVDRFRPAATDTASVAVAPGDRLLPPRVAAALDAAKAAGRAKPMLVYSTLASTDEGKLERSSALGQLVSAAELAVTLVAAVACFARGGAASTNAAFCFAFRFAALCITLLPDETVWLAWQANLTASAFLALVSVTVVFQRGGTDVSRWPGYLASLVVWLVYALVSVAVFRVHVRFGAMFLEATLAAASIATTAAALSLLFTLRQLALVDCNGGGKQRQQQQQQQQSAPTAKGKSTLATRRRRRIAGALVGIALHAAACSVLWRVSTLLSAVANVAASALIVRLAGALDRRAPTHNTLPTFSSTSSRWRTLMRVLTVALLVAAVCYACVGVYRYADGRLCRHGGGDGGGDPLCASSKLTAIDTYTRFLYRVVRDSIEAGANETTAAAVRVHVPKRRVSLPRIEALPGHYLPTTDEDMDERGVEANALDYLRDRLLRSPMAFPLRDVAERYASVDEGRATLALAAGGTVAPVARWDDLLSDAALSRWAFGGLAAHCVQRVPPRSLRSPAGDPDAARFVVDFRWMRDLEVRDGFERYGAAAYFDEQLAVTRIHWSHADKDVRPGDPDWPRAKFVWRSSVLVGVTLRDHLAFVHLKLATLVIEAVREELEPFHPLRRMLAPFTYRTIEVNRGAASYLCAVRGVLHRATALSERGLADGFAAALAKPLGVGLFERARADRLDELGDDYPFLRDGLEYRAIVERLVSGYVAEYYAGGDQELLEDAQVQALWHHIARRRPLPAAPELPDIETRAQLVQMLTEFIVHVTAFHKHVGSVGAYVMDPSVATSKLRPNENVADVQASFQTLIIAMFTAYPQPKLLDDFRHVLLPDEHLGVTSQLFANFTDEMRRLSATVDERNKHRRFASNAFNPKKLLSAVSI
jgi:Lipoxygenase